MPSHFSLSRFGAVVSALVLAAIGVTPTMAAESLPGLKPFTARDMVRLERVSDAQVSPDGALIVYDQRSVDFAGNASHHALWLVEAKPGATPHRLAASDPDATHPRWSADGKAIYFLSNRSGSAQVWRMDVTGTTAVQVTKLPLDVAEFRLAPDMQTLVVALAVRPECPDLACTVAAAKKPAIKRPAALFMTSFLSVIGIVGPMGRAITCLRSPSPPAARSTVRRGI